MSFGFTTQQAEPCLMWFLLGVVCGIALTIGVTVFATAVAVGKGLHW